MAVAPACDFLLVVGFLGIVAVLPVAGVQQGEGLRNLAAEIERPERRQVVRRYGLCLALPPLGAAGVFDDRVADFLLMLARIDDDRRAAAEPEEAIAGLHALLHGLAVETNGDPLLNDGDHLGAERAVRFDAPGRSYIEDLEGGLALPCFVQQSAILLVARQITQQAELLVELGGRGKAFAHGRPQPVAVPFVEVEYPGTVEL